MHNNGHRHKSEGLIEGRGVRIAVIGSGYVGLVVAACFAEIGHTVTCVDSDKEKIAALASGRIPIHEEMLPELLARHRHVRLTFSSSMKEAVKTAEVVFIAVGTPAMVNGEADLSYVEQVAAEIAQYIDDYKVIVEKSTVPVTTSDSIVQMMLSSGLSRDSFDVVSNPEFLREGTAVVDFLHADRIIVGTESDRAYDILARIYLPLTSGIYFESSASIPGTRNSSCPVPLLRTSARSAELIKHASNAFLGHEDKFYQLCVEHV